MNRLLVILLIPTLAMAGTSRYVDAPELKTKDRAAINQNFQNIDIGMSNFVKRSSTETITGVKYFSKPVTFGVGTTDINIQINGKTSTGAGAGTLTNAPSAGNPTGYLSVNINGTERKIPYW
jgi:hypothetical protein